MRAIAGFLGAALALLNGCAAYDSMTLHPDVLIDSSFTADEYEGIEKGFGVWETQGVTFTRKMVSHADIIGMGLASKEDNTIYIVRNATSHDRDCPGEFNERKGFTAESNAAEEWTRTHGNGSAVICINAPLLNGIGGDVWKTSTAHELGHAFHLPHDRKSDFSLMNPTIGQSQVPYLTCNDRKHFAAAWGLASPTCEDSTMKLPDSFKCDKEDPRCE